ncbi:MAG: hypothetical protein N4A65_09330 [Cohaesibacter sp.]|nr:hypothetical protein [Cohaesibacter sp.]
MLIKYLSREGGFIQRIEFPDFIACRPCEKGGAERCFGQVTNMGSLGTFAAFGTNFHFWDKADFATDENNGRSISSNGHSAKVKITHHKNWWQVFFKKSTYCCNRLGK